MHFLAATVVPVLDGRTVEVASTTNVLHQLHVHGDRLDVGGGRGRRASAARRPLTRRRRALIFTEANPAIHLWRPSEGRVISSGWVARNPEIRAFARRRSLHDYDGQASAERVCSRPRLTTPMRDRVDRGAPVDLTCRAFVRGWRPVIDPAIAKATPVSRTAARAEVELSVQRAIFISRRSVSDLLCLRR